jgi:hypothetical protein
MLLLPAWRVGLVAVLCLPLAVLASGCLVCASYAPRGTVGSHDFW